MSNNEKYWYGFAKLTKASSHFVNILYNYFGSIELAWNAQTYDLWKIPGLKKSTIEAFLEERKNINPEECMDYIKERGFDFIHPEDKRYPEALKNIDNPPTGLFMTGDIELCNLERAIAVVGSRRASENSKAVLRNILDGFHNTDVCIISGMAEGIDTVAHTSALNNNLKTIAVIGGGFDKLYPKSNKKLFERIKDNQGAVLTEYWPDSDALSFHFPLRNRIVSGLSKGVLVAEAALKSGAMITARLALEQGKELMCMPGLISNPNTQGVYKLIKTGASVITSYEDILDAMGWKIEKIPSNNNKSDNKFSTEELLILDAIKKDMLNIDELILKTNLNINDLMIILTKLELEGIISQTNGEKYISLI